MRRECGYSCPRNYRGADDDCGADDDLRFGLETGYLFGTSL